MTASAAGEVPSSRQREAPWADELLDDDEAAAPVFNHAGIVRMVRRRLDLSQRDLATLLGVGHSTISHAEGQHGGISLDLLVRVLAAGGLRLAAVETETGTEVEPEPAQVVRDRSGRRFPAHLDVRPATQADAPHMSWRPDRPEPQVTFCHRRGRSIRRAREGTPSRHLTLGELLQSRTRWRPGTDGRSRTACIVQPCQQNDPVSYRAWVNSFDDLDPDPDDTADPSIWSTDWPDWVRSPSDGRSVREGPN